MAADQPSVRAAILADLRKAVAGRTPSLALPPERVMQTSTFTDRVMEFRHNLEAVSGEFHQTGGWEEVAAFLGRGVAEGRWKKVVSLEETLCQQLTGGGFSLVPTEGVSAECEAMVTSCSALAASTGSVVVTSALTGSRKAFVWPEVHIVVARETQLAATLEEAYTKAMTPSGGQDPSMITIITGPSRTADIEKTLVLGAHGPRQLIVLLIKNL